MHYLDFSFGLALRSHSSMAHRARGVFNIASHFLVDKGLNILYPNKWHEWKERAAYERAKPYEPTSGNTPGGQLNASV